jgi:simple sugar transport system ATP-binding protein
VLHAAASSVDKTRVSEAMIGESEPLTAPSKVMPREAGRDRRAARLENVTVRSERQMSADVLTDVTLNVEHGEILGIAALDGNGQRELVRLLAGRVGAYRGRVSIPSVVGFVPEDRQRDALVLEESLTFNTALDGAGRRRGIVRWSEQRERTRRVIAGYDVRGGSPETVARVLSGGNQQKFVLGRALDATPEMIVVENPTRGLDIRATAAVHARLRLAAAEGAAVVLYSQDLDEVMALATRIVVVHRGRVRNVPLDRALVGRAMLGIA